VSLRAGGFRDKERGSTREQNQVYGTIKKIMKDKGFGFIIPDDGSEEIFFHRSRLAPKVYFEDLRDGNEVQFEVRAGEKGRQAFNLKPR
jgi:CspA family cold shock protein